MDSLTTLPESAELLQRLKSVENNPYAEERLYPSLVGELTGASMSGVGIAVVFARAIAEYAGSSVGVLVAAYANVESWITAIVDDTTVREEALATARQAGITVN